MIKFFISKFKLILEVGHVVVEVEHVVLEHVQVIKFELFNCCVKSINDIPKNPVFYLRVWSLPRFYSEY
jgi:hypothetical protein